MRIVARIRRRANASSDSPSIGKRSASRTAAVTSATARPGGEEIPGDDEDEKDKDASSRLKIPEQARRTSQRAAGEGDETDENAAHRTGDGAPSPLGMIRECGPAPVQAAVAVVVR